MQETLLTLHHADTRRPEYALTLECPLSLPTPSVVAVYGPNASGKTLLADLLTAKHPLRGDGGLVYGHNSTRPPERVGPLPTCCSKTSTAEPNRPITNNVGTTATSKCFPLWPNSWPPLTRQIRPTP